MAGAIDVKQTDSEKSTSQLWTGASTARGMMDGSNWTINMSSGGSRQQVGGMPTWVYIAGAVAAAWWLWKKK